MSCCEEDECWISITEASRLLGVSRRTLMRRIQESDSETRIEMRGRRVRLVKLSKARQLVEGDAGKWDEVIDNALTIVFLAFHRLYTSLYFGPERPLDLDELRRGRLGHDLFQLARLAEGTIEASRESTNERIDSVLQPFFWAPMIDDYYVPRAFWETDLGRMIMRAKLRVYRPEELISIGTAAHRLGFTRPGIYRLMDDKYLDFVIDDRSRRVLIASEDVEVLEGEFEAESEPTLRECVVTK